MYSYFDVFIYLVFVKMSPIVSGAIVKICFYLSKYLQGVSKKMSFLGKIAINTLKLIKNANDRGVLENSGNLLPHGH